MSEDHVFETVAWHPPVTRARLYVLATMEIDVVCLLRSVLTVYSAMAVVYVDYHETQAAGEALPQGGEKVPVLEQP
jgi:hypothetical protein